MSNIKQSLLSIFRLIIIAVFAFSQNYYVKGQDAYSLIAIPPSPNAASLGQYVDVPVNYYTGVPNISIPLYEVKSGEIEMPISLSYHSSGVKVGQEASWVGLGWSFNCGGLITRQIRGKDDFGSGGFVTTGELPPATDDNLPAHLNPDLEYNEYVKIHQGITDGEPDIFYYNFFGYSGKLFFEKQAGNKVVGTSTNQNNLKFTYDLDLKEWEVIDGNGWVYYLGTAEITHNYSRKTTTYIDVDQLSGDDRTTDELGNISAWYIDRIVTPKGDEVNFSYSDGNYQTIGQVNYSETKYTVLEVDDSYAYGHDLIPVEWPDEGFIASMQRVEDVYLERIEFKGGYILLSLEDRDDMRTYSVGPIPDEPKRLDYFKVFDNDDKLIKEVDLTYSYFNESNSSQHNKENYLRLRLDQVQEYYSNANSFRPPYIFTYDDIELPRKNSFSIDHWGYHNGSNNDEVRLSNIVHDMREWSGTFTITNQSSPDLTAPSLCTQFFDEEDVYGKRANLNGAFREPNANVMQAGILESIKYPTGGEAKFYYEPNDYHFEEKTSYNNIPVTKKAEDDCFSDNSVIVLDDLTMVELEVEVINAFEDWYARLEDAEGNIILDFSSDDGSDEFSYYATFLLDAGEYRLKKSHNCTGPAYITFNAHYILLEPTVNEIGAGLRVQAIEHFTSQGTIATKTIFNYDENGISTGRLLSPLKLFYNFNAIQTQARQVHIFDLIVEIFLSYLVTTSESVIPMASSAQGNSIGYNSVSVKQVDQNGGDIGTSKYYYENVEELTVENALPYIPNFINLANGNIIREEVYNVDHQMVSSKDYQYKEYPDSEISVKAVKLYPNPSNGGGFTGYIRFYDTYSHWSYLETVVETEFFPSSGSSSLTNEINYEYNLENLQISCETVNQSDGKLYRTNYTYPVSYPSTNRACGGEISDAVIALRNQNQINIPIEITHEIDGKVEASSLRTFYEKNNGAIVLGQVYELAVEEPIEDFNEFKILSYPSALADQCGDGYTMDSRYKMTYDLTRHDDYGNPLEWQGRDGILQSRIYDDTGEFPLAEAVNAEIFYDGFEDNLGWALLSGVLSYSTPQSKTGWKSLALTSAPGPGNGLVVESILQDASIETVQKYRIEAWVKGQDAKFVIAQYCGASVAVSYESTIDLPNETEWHWIHWDLEFTSSCSTAIQLYLQNTYDVATSNTTYFDDLRIYPIDAQMTSYTYDQLVGMTSKTDARGVMTYYEYDSNNRLHQIKDQDGNILKQYAYNYKNQ